ncbi:hypothetical protein MHEL_32510 [Mycolicibacterium helvum]|uniref:Uncharacterized protein n=1 Tax=Mycolicibacterium helvum TaxID=1534349 RepID=A0A7I7T7F7_9MYCO|nr:hypothetical protein MHEL_32510 [Mycolicibacterium helvum]
MAGGWIASITMSAISSDDEALAGPGVGVGLGAAAALPPAAAPTRTAAVAAIAAARDHIHMVMSFRPLLIPTCAAKLTGRRLSRLSRINLRGLGGAVPLTSKVQAKGATLC